MERIFRPESPDFLRVNYRRWCWQWTDLRRRNPHAQFQWYTLNLVRVNHLLLPSLQVITNFHCSFCDQKNLIIYVVEPTVEHFKPKTQFPLLSYYWWNLFVCCTSCQKKLERFTPDLLKPDRATYDFDYYFIINWINFHIEPRYVDPDPKYYAAINTIELYGLNKGGKPQARRRELGMYLNSINPDIEEFSYRFLIRRAN